MTVSITCCFAIRYDLPDMRNKVNTRLLFRSIAEGDSQGAFWELHEAFFSPLHRLIYSLVRNREVAEELTSDVFVQLWKSRYRLGGVENPEVYLFISARNRAFTHLRLQNAVAREMSGLLDFDLVLERNPEDIMISSEMIARINAAIAELPARCKLIFMLVKENNLKYREVAEILDISVKTVEAQMSIAFKKLSQSIPFHTY